MSAHPHTLQVAAGAIKAQIRELNVDALDALLTAQDELLKGVVRGEAPLLQKTKRATEAVALKAVAILDEIRSYEEASR